MRSAKRRALIEKRKQKNRFSGLFLKIVLPVALILAAVVFLKINTQYWDGKEKFAVAYRLESGDVAVTLLDPKLSEVITLTIPGDTQVEVARNYGTMRIKNVWQLGINEKIKGRLLSETLTQNFLFPVFLWSESDAKSLGEGNLNGILRFIFIPSSTNIPFGDRLSAGFFSLRIQEIGRSNIDLGKSQFLAKQRLNDGQNGYILSGPVSQRLTVYFSDNYVANTYVADKSLRVGITDATGEPGVAEKMGQIVEVLGGKVISIDKNSVADTDCLVTGRDRIVIKKVANLFSCKIGKVGGDLDLQISLGTAFAKRF